jgi:hypothetical protein
MMDRRLEQTLMALAQQYAPQALRQWDRRGNEGQQLASLARQLANFNLLVIVGDFPQSLQSLTQDVATQIQAWVNGYGQMYHLLAGALFPSYIQLNAQYADDRWPVIIYMQGAATPVIQKLAGYVAPFVVYRQMDARVSEAELLGIMDLVLDELEAGSIPRDAYKKLRADGVGILKDMLNMPIRQLPLTEFDRPIITDSQRIAPPPLPTVAPPEPPTLPEEDSQITRIDLGSLPPEKAAYTRGETEKLTQTQNMTPNTAAITSEQPPVPPPPPETNPLKGSSIPIFFNRKKKDNSK